MSANATLLLTTAAVPFAQSNVGPSSNGAATPSTIVTIESTQRRQTITSFGGAFNEQGWEALQVLSASDREAAL
ncbi:MAG TPA: hypothetical protein VEQ59_01365, partial [Polyangiaceae bacterium]|nr:hypothetical protein [Polyangiaceae bacterium]